MLRFIINFLSKRYTLKLNKSKTGVNGEKAVINTVEKFNTNYPFY